MGSISTGRWRAHRRLRGASVAATLVVAVTATAATHARAETLPFPTAGTCVFNGSATFTPNLTLAPTSNLEVVISGSGTCEGAGIPLGETVYFAPDFIGYEPLASCALTEGSMVGVLDFSGGTPASYTGGATYIGGPATSTVTIASTGMIGTATLVWTDPSAIVSCPTSGTASTPLTGTFTFVAP